MHDIGRLFILGFDGFSAPDSLKKISKKFNLGGVILFGRNIESPQQLKNLTTELRTLSNENPFFISIDQEGGRVQRLSPPQFSKYPSAGQIGIEQAFAIGQKMGQEMKNLGMNLNFAPVLDVNTNSANPIIGDRSFGQDPQTVVEIARDFLKGLEESVLGCGKHFPGHGDTDSDSHLALPIVSHDKERLEKIELYPFQEMIKSGLKMMMSAHVLYPALDSKNPATFSKTILDDIARKKLGFEGVIITDDMCMAGALSQADLPAASIQAFAAGCDLILICHNFERHEEVIETLSKEIKKSPALQKRAVESLKRLLGVRSWGLGGEK